MDGQQIANYEAQTWSASYRPSDGMRMVSRLVVDVPYLDYYVHANVARKRRIAFLICWIRIMK